MNQVAVQELIARAQEGDRDAFGRLMVMHQEAAFRMACRLTGDAETAESVAQEAFVQAWRSLATFKGESQFMTWYYSILVRKAADWHRQSKRSRAALPLDQDIPVIRDKRRPAAPTPAENLQAKDLERLLGEAIARLPSDQRAALMIVAKGGLSYDEAASALGCSSGTVAWRIWNARRQLREMLKGHI